MITFQYTHTHSISISYRFVFQLIHINGKWQMAEWLNSVYKCDADVQTTKRGKTEATETENKQRKTRRYTASEHGRKNTHGKSKIIMSLCLTLATN